MKKHEALGIKIGKSIPVPIGKIDEQKKIVDGKLKRILKKTINSFFCVTGYHTFPYKNRVIDINNKDISDNTIFWTKKCIHCGSKEK